MRFGDGPAPAAWTKEIGQLVKNLAPNHLFSKKSNSTLTVTSQLLTWIQWTERVSKVPEIDSLVDPH